MPDWTRYRKCPVCFAALGQPCTSQVGTLAGGRVGVTTDRDRPHSRRQLRAGYARTGGDR